MRTAVLVVAVAVAAAACSKDAPETAPAASVKGGGPFDASRDSGVDIQAALDRAKTERKRVLIEVGGNTCERCMTLQAFYGANAELAALRDAKFVVVLAAAEAGKPLPAALRGYPPPARFPHLYVLDENGSLLQSQDTAALEKGPSYDLEKLTFFMKDFGTRR